MAVTFDLSGSVLITEGNWRDHVQPLSGPDGPGYVPRDYDRHPVGSYKGGRKFPDALRYDEKQLREIFREQEAKKTSLRHIQDRSPRGWLRQSPTNYCWCYAVTVAVMLIRVCANLPFVRLSPFSVACPIKNFRNNGGWGTQALAYMVEHGVAAEEFWPMETPEMSSAECERANMAAIRNGRQYFESSRANAAEHKITEFFDVGDRDWNAKLSLLARRIPVPCGYSWMGHEMTSVRGIVLPSGELAAEDSDHYGRDGTPNYRIMTERRGTPDDACAPVVSDPNFDA